MDPQLCVSGSRGQPCHGAITGPCPDQFCDHRSGGMSFGTGLDVPGRYQSCLDSICTSEDRMNLSGIKVWVAPDPVDMRKGVDGLSQYVRHTLGHNPCAGEAFLFCNRDRTRIKILLWDGTGVWLCQRRLHRGRFTWADSHRATFSLSAIEWEWLIRGVDWRRVTAVPTPDWMP